MTWVRHSEYFSCISLFADLINSEMWGLGDVKPALRGPRHRLLLGGLL